MKFIFKKLSKDLTISESENGDILIIAERKLEYKFTEELDINQQKKLLEYLKKKLEGE